MTPSDELRKWYHAHPAELAEFAGRYRAELESQGALERLRKAGEVVTLLTARKETEGSHLGVLLDALESHPS